MEIEIVRVPVDPARRDEMLAVLHAAGVNGYLSRPLCAGVEMVPQDDRIVIVARWTSSEAHQAAAASEVGQAFFQALGDIASGPPEIESFLPQVVGGRLAGSVALVTGGASGIGRAVVDAFVREGARVAAVDINEDNLRAVARAHGDNVHCIRADLSTLEGNRKAVEEAVRTFGRLDTFVGNAGLFDGFADFSATEAAALDKGFDLLFDINVKGLILGCKEALPHLVTARGSIIVTLSNASLYPDGGGVMYVASKHAALGVVRQLAHELAPAVRVNGVAPGATRSPIGVPDVFGGPLDQTAPEMSEMIAGLVPVGFHSEPADHAEAYVLLAAAGESRVMTGTIIETDGGLGIRGLRRPRGGDHLLVE